MTELDTKFMYESVLIISVPFFLNQKFIKQFVPCDFCTRGEKENS